MSAALAGFAHLPDLSDAQLMALSDWKPNRPHRITRELKEQAVRNRYPDGVPVHEVPRIA